jgi:phosphatidylinositol alpha-1,6-mannosyltransferase
MKVLYLGTNLLSKGGIPRYSRYQVRALRESWGTDAVDVFCLHPEGDDDFEDPFELDWVGGGTGRVSRLHFAARAIHRARARRPDVVLANHLSLAPVAVAAARASGARSLLNVYGLEIRTGGRTRDRWGLQHTDQLISDCHFTARYVTERLGIPEERIRVVWDCVDLDRFAPAPPNARLADRYGIKLRQGELRLMTLGRVCRGSRHKGYERMLDVVASIPRELAVLYIIAGSGDFVEDLRALAEHKGIGDRVVFTGSIHERDLAGIYHCCDVFCLISDRGEGRGEGIPLTPLEAAACGKPILVGNQDGSQEAVLEGQNGHVFDPFDIPAIADTISYLHERPEVRWKLGEAARERVKAEHSFPIFKERMIAALKRATQH